MNQTSLPKLYSMTQIGLATFLGSALAAGYMLASNYSALGQRQPAIMVLIGSIVIVCLLMLVPGNAAQNPLLAVTVMFGQIAIVLLITNALQGKMLESFVQMGGQYHSMLRTVCIGIVASLIIGTVFILIAGPQVPASGT